MMLEDLIGTRLVFGVPGTTITPEIIRHFKETHCRGLILYRINCESADQLRKMISDLENALGWRLLVCADQEGGRVVMFGDGVTVFPSAQAFGRTGNTQLARRQGEQEGRELRRLGIDVNFAPVLDVLTDTYSPNIGIRAFGSDPEVVAKMGAARISAMQVEGVSACAKHFPGLGPANLDPHLNLPTLSFTWEDLERIHMIPFMRAMRTGVHSIMTSHPLYPNLDPTPRTPATFSRKIVHDYLRQKVGYKGVIFSDDLEMGAITELCPIGEAAVKAIEAGHDVVLACHDMKAQREVYDALVAAYTSNRLSHKDLEESVKRVQGLQSKRTERFSPLPATEARAQKEKSDAELLVKEICDASVTTIRQGPGLVAGASTAVIFPKLSALADKIMIERAMLDEPHFLKDLLAPLGVTPSVQLVSIDPTDDEIAAARSAASAADQTVAFLFDAHIYPRTQRLLEAIRSTGRRTVIVLLRDAYDQEFIPDGTLCLTNYGFRVCDLRAVASRLLSPSVVTS